VPVAMTIGLLLFAAWVFALAVMGLAYGLVSPSSHLR